MNSWSSGSWKTRATRWRMAARLAFVTGIPPTVTVPACGSRMPLRCRTSVVLPAPFGTEDRDPLAGVDVQVDAGERLAAVRVGEAQTLDVERAAHVTSVRHERDAHAEQRRPARRSARGRRRASPARRGRAWRPRSPATPWRGAPARPARRSARTGCRPTRRAPGPATASAGRTRGTGGRRSCGRPRPRSRRGSGP